jgi:predicted Zn finger-like uncharacterized protein
MIVICTGCQAKFRVADEKIGPRGAKVRCTRCQAVFVVKREEAPPPPAPKIDLDLTPGLARPSPPADPFAAPPAGASVIPFPAGAAPPGSSGPAIDPFAAAGLDVYGSEASPEDPFARAGLATPATTPPPAAAPPDPFASASSAPFGAGRTTSSASLPVTDLSQLLGGAAGEPAAAPPAAHRAAPPSPPTAPPPAPTFAGFPADLALEEASGAHPGPFPAAPAPFADPEDVVQADPGYFPSPGSSYDHGSMAMAPGEESLALATEQTPPPMLAPPSSPPPRGLPEPVPPADGDDLGAFLPSEDAWTSHAPPAAIPVGVEPGPPPGALPGPAPVAAAQRAPEPPQHRVRNAALNALALVAVLVLAMAIRAVIRGDAPLGPGAFRPSTLMRSFRGAEPAGPFELSEVRTGVYAQRGGGALLFVHGVVVCRPPAPVAAVRVEAELVRDGQVLARGNAVAGAVPSPEEVWRATDRAALDALGVELRKRAPKGVAPGDRLGFLVTLADAPADLSGTSVRLKALPDGGAGN